MNSLAQLGTAMTTERPHIHNRAFRNLTALACTVWLVSGQALPQAHACGPTPPSVTLLARNGGVFEGTRTLKLYVYGFTFELEDARVTLTDVSTQEPVAVSATLRATQVDWLYELNLAADALKAGSAYTLEFVIEPTEGWTGYTQKVDFVALEQPREPDMLGELVQESAHAGVIGLGGCGEQRTGVQAVLGIRASEDVLPWARAAQHQLLVDGELMPSPELPMVDYVAREKALRVRAYAICSQEPLTGSEMGTSPDADVIDVELAPGTYRVAWRTVFPSGKSLTTEPIDLKLDCASVPGRNGPDDDVVVNNGCALVRGRGEANRWVISFAALAVLWWRTRPRRRAALVKP